MATDEPKIPATQTPTKAEIAAAATKAYEPGFRADGSAYPGVDPDTGERKSVTWAGLREEFGDRKGAQIYNDIAVAGFGGVQASRPALSLLSLKDDRPVQFLDEDRLAKRVKRREKVLQILAEAEANRAKEA